MSKQYITSVANVPDQPAPISQAVVVDGVCHISGQLAVYEDGYRAGTASQEAGRAFDLVFMIAAEAGFTVDDIVYVDVAFSDIDRDLPALNEIYRDRFQNYPARTVYQAARLPYGAKIKVQAIAMREHAPKG